MTAIIEDIPSPLTEWELELMVHPLANGDMHAVDVEGNILGAGELWERLGSSIGPAKPSTTKAVGFIYPRSSNAPTEPAGYVTDGDILMYLYRSVR